MSNAQRFSYQIRFIHNRSARQGFTLVELLVVIGIIAILLGVLLVAMARVREQSRLVLCASIQRELGTLAIGRAAATGGYSFLAGDIQTGPENGRTLQELLGDSGMTRYVWQSVHEAGLTGTFPIMQPLGFPYCLLNPKKPVPSVIAVDDIPQEYVRWRCPNLPMKEPDDIVVGTLRFNLGGRYLAAFIWASDTGYVLNGVLLGFHFDDNRNAKRGMITRSRDSAGTVLLADASLHAAPMPSGVWFDDPPLNGSQPSVELAQQRPYAAQASLERHRTRANVLMVDGHVETVTAGSPEWLRLSLNP